MRDYMQYVGEHDGESHVPGDPQEMRRCADCNVPAYYDTDSGPDADFEYEGYHHADPSVPGCFLIPEEDHPNYLPEWNAEAVALGFCLVHEPGDAACGETSMCPKVEADWTDVEGATGRCDTCGAVEINNTAPCEHFGTDAYALA